MKLNPEKPFLFIHVSKTGGTSLQKVFEKWYKDRLGYNYYNYKSGQSTPKHNIDDVDCIYGHFLSEYGCGLERYSSINQYCLFMRDPVEHHTSYYNYRCQFQDMPEINHFFRNSQSDMLATLPGGEEEWERVFFVGIYERFSQDVEKLRQMLGKPKVEIPHTNRTNYTYTPNSESVKIFCDNHSELIDVYEIYKNI